MAYSANSTFDPWCKILKVHRWYTDLISKTLGANLADDMHDLIDVLRSEVSSTLTANEIERDIAISLNNDLSAHRDSILGFAAQIKSWSEDFILRRMKEILPSTRDSVAEILNALDRKMDDAGDTVEGNSFGASAVDSTKLTLSNAGTLTIDETTGFCRPNGLIEVVCADTSTQGSELWDVFHNLLGQATGQATTGVQFEYETAGFKFTIDVGTEIAESGDAYDPPGQLSNWTLTGFTESNTDVGKLYAVVKRNPGTYTNRVYVSLYNDSTNMAFPTSANLVAQGYAEGPYPAVITLDEQEDSGISGSVRLSKHPVSDRTITITLPLFLVGDIFSFTTTSDDEGLVFSMVRDLHNHILPASVAGYSISDSKIM